MQYVMALDQGTTSSRTIIFDKNANIVSSESKEFEQIYPKPGWVEHNPYDILHSQISSIQIALEKSEIDVSKVAAIGITNQRETTIVWDKDTGRPVYNAVVWQCRRSADICEDLIKRGLDKTVYQKTGLIMDAYFSASKIKWILDNVKGAKEKAQTGKLLFGTVDSWLIWNLTNKKCHITDYSNASRTMLYNIYDKCWDNELLDIFGIPKSMLPKVVDSSGICGYTDKSYFGREIPIAGIAGDQQAALFGQNCFSAGEAKNTYGTGCFLLMNTGEKPIESKHNLLTTIAWGIDGKIEYALEGSVFIAGAAVSWLRDELRIIQSPAETESLAKEVSDNGGVYFVPAFTGLGAPYWDMYARGSLMGLTRGSNRAHIVRAALESIAYQTKDLIETMKKDSQMPISVLKVDGGASSNNFLMQFQADMLDINVRRCKTTETTALGAAFLAGMACGVWKSKDEIKEKCSSYIEYKPNMKSRLRNEYYQNWKKAVERCKGWIEK